jgi:hypothetical protein
MILHEVVDGPRVVYDLPTALQLKEGSNMLKRLRRGSKVTMIASVGSYEAGLSYRLPAALADEYIAKGYAEGELSRPMEHAEINALRSTVQVVKFGG